MSNQRIERVVSSTKAYYDGPADQVYRTIWGDNVHLGVPRNSTSSHLENMEHTNELMAQEVSLSPGLQVLDVGCGYGSTARYLAANYGCKVTGINISERELELATQRAREAGLEHLLSFEYGDFHQLKYPNSSFDVVWSQEAFLHGADKSRILEECYRVVRPGGPLIFTDILVKRETPSEVRERIYDRVKSPDIWDAADYQKALLQKGFQLQKSLDWSQYVAPSYGWVRDQLKNNRTALLERVDGEAIDRTIDALSFWVDSAHAGNIGWALFLATRPG